MRFRVTRRLQRVAPYFVIGCLLGAMWIARPAAEFRLPATASIGKFTHVYNPPLHPVTIGLGQALFSILGLAIFARRGR